MEFWLPDPSPSLGGCTCGEPARDVQPFHDGRDMAADGRGADPGAAGDCLIVQAFGHQLQHRLLRRRQPVTRHSGP